MNRCECKVVGCRCLRKSPINGQGKCAECATGQHSDAHGRPLCSSPMCRRSTTVATHRVVFDEGKQPLVCEPCSDEWYRIGVNVTPLEAPV